MVLRKLYGGTVVGFKNLLTIGYSFSPGPRLDRRDYRRRLGTPFPCQRSIVLFLLHKLERHSHSLFGNSYSSSLFFDTIAWTHRELKLYCDALEQGFVGVVRGVGRIYSRRVIRKCDLQSSDNRSAAT